MSNQVLQPQYPAQYQQPVIIIQPSENTMNDTIAYPAKH